MSDRLLSSRAVIIKQIRVRLARWSTLSISTQRYSHGSVRAPPGRVDAVRARPCTDPLRIAMITGTYVTQPEYAGAPNRCARGESADMTARFAENLPASLGPDIDAHDTPIKHGRRQIT
jgi:hypothetical protein